MPGLPRSLYSNPREGTTQMKKLALAASITAAATLSLACTSDTRTTPVAHHDPAPLRTAVAPSAETINPISVGQSAPDVAVQHTDGTPITIPSMVEEGPVLLVFYRGGWCPVCMRHFADLARIQGDLDNRGVRMIGISPDSTAKLAEYSVERDIPYALLSDSTHAASRAFGVAFSVDDATNTALRGYGINLEEWNESNERILPVPAAFLIDGNGIIRYAHTNPDYRVRLSGDDILAAVDSGMN